MNLLIVFMNVFYIVRYVTGRSLVTTTFWVSLRWFFYITFIILWKTDRDDSLFSLFEVFYCDCSSVCFHVVARVVFLKVRFSSLSLSCLKCWRHRSLVWCGKIGLVLSLPSEPCSCLACTWPKDVGASVLVFLVLPCLCLCPLSVGTLSSCALLSVHPSHLLICHPLQKASQNFLLFIF